jgi:hypothetical protein
VVATGWRASAVGLGRAGGSTRAAWVTASSGWRGNWGCSDGVDGGDNGWDASRDIDGGENWRNDPARRLRWRRQRRMGRWWRGVVGWDGGLAGRRRGIRVGHWAVRRGGESLGCLAADRAIGDSWWAGGNGVLSGSIDG